MAMRIFVRVDVSFSTTEYSDHTRTVRGQHKAEQRFKSAVLDGSAVAFKQRAFDLVAA